MAIPEFKAFDLQHPTVEEFEAHAALCEIEHNRIFREEWLSAALSEKEFQQTLAIPTAILIEMYSEIRFHGPNAELWEKDLRVLCQLLDEIVRTRGKNREHNLELLKEFSELYSSPLAGKSNMYSEATEAFRIGEYMLDSASYFENPDYPLSTVVHHRIQILPVFTTAGLEDIKTFDMLVDCFSRFSLLRDLYEKYEDEEPLVGKHREFVEKLYAHVNNYIH